MEKSKVFLVDDNLIVLESLTKLINRDPKLLVCGEADRAYKALEMIGALNPDLAVIDLGLPDMDGIDLIRSLRQQDARLPVLVLSMLDETAFGERALTAGAQGYIMKQHSVNNIMMAIHSVLAGNTYISDQLAAQIRQSACGNRGSLT